jgi:hypothetical protein
VKLGKKRQAEYRQRLREAGFKAKEVWAHIEDWPVTERLVERLRKRRERK